MIGNMKKTIWIVIALLVSFQAFAEEIEVPEEELARESTLPVFDQRHAVLNRNIISEKHAEIGLGWGMELNEPFYNGNMLNGDITYHLTDTHALNIQGLYWLPGLSTYGNQLKQPPPANASFKAFDASEAPHPSWAVIGNYEYVAYYGKISLTKQAVMNLNLFGILGAGYINMGNVNSLAFNVGLGQNFFFSKHVGLRWSLRWLIFQGPDATSLQLTPGVAAPAASQFGNRMYYNAQLGLELVFIL
jgi:outer membrane beta-barrel protein